MSRTPGDGSSTPLRVIATIGMDGGVMADAARRADATGSPPTRPCGRRELRRALTTGPAGLVLPLALSDPALAASEAWGLASGLLGVSMMIGMSVFAATMAILYVRERESWRKREAALVVQAEAAARRADQAEAFAATDDHVVVTWKSPTSAPEIAGATDFLGAAARGPGAPPSPLALGSWVSPGDVKPLGDAIEALKQRGCQFDLAVSTRSGGVVEARGRAIGGQAVVSLKGATPLKAALVAAEAARGADADRIQALTALADGSQGPAWCRDRDGHLVWVNAAYARAVEASSPEDAVARQLELMDRDAREASAAARARQEPFAARAPVVVGGRRLILDLSERPTAAGFVGQATDVTELETLRADLKRQMEAYARVLDRVPTAVAVFDARQRLAYRNAAFDRLWSLDAAYLDSLPTDGEILDRLRTARRLPEVGAYKDWKADRLSAYAALETREDWWYLPDGRAIHVTTSPHPLGGVIHMFDDVTERFSLESKVNALGRMQRETLDALREGVAVFGSDGRLKLSNPAFAQLWQLSPAMLAAAPHVDELVPLCTTLCENAEPWDRLRGAIVDMRERRDDLAARMTRRDGSVLDCALAPLPDGATLLTFADATASVNVEKALTERNQALEKAARLRDDFVHHVSYALRSPLNAIIGFAQLIGEEIAGPLNPRQREYAELILRSSGTLLAIVNDILDLASIDNDDIRLEMEPTEVADLIASAARGLEDQLAEHRITLATRIAPDASVLLCDPRRMRQALYNLMSNAVGFSEPGQTIEVEAVREGKDVVFRIIDHGRGIPDALRERVFDRFESHTAGTRHRGVGLGLAIVRSFVGLHGGSVSIDATPGGGATVTCRVPGAA